MELNLTSNLPINGETYPGKYQLGDEAEIDILAFENRILGFYLARRKADLGTEPIS